MADRQRRPGRREQMVYDPGEDKRSVEEFDEQLEWQRLEGRRLRACRRRLSQWPTAKLRALRARGYDHVDEDELDDHLRRFNIAGEILRERETGRRESAMVRDGCVWFITVPVVAADSVSPRTRTRTRERRPGCRRRSSSSSRTSSSDPGDSDPEPEPVVPARPAHGWALLVSRARS